MKSTFFFLSMLSLMANIYTYGASVVNQPHRDAESWVHIDFDEAMQTTQFHKQVLMTRLKVKVDGYQFLRLCKQLYNTYNVKSIPVADTPIIPKIIHQIWLGSPVPEAFKVYMNSWTKCHAGPDWEYRLWTDKEVESLELYNRVLYDKADNFAAKADILRLELIYQFGGVYVDMDFECFKPLDCLHYRYNFYSGLQPLDSGFAQIGNALFAAAPGHPILRDCIEHMRVSWYNWGSVPEKTGPIPFTQSFCRMAGKNGSKDVAFPAFYFYPLSCSEHELKRDEWCKKGAIAVHHWAKSWLPKSARPVEFQQLH